MASMDAGFSADPLVQKRRAGGNAGVETIGWCVFTDIVYVSTGRTHLDVLLPGNGRKPSSGIWVKRDRVTQALLQKSNVPTTLCPAPDLVIWACQSQKKRGLGCFQHLHVNIVSYQ